MCRNIRQLHNFDPPATSEEVRAAALQYVRKVVGATKPSQANQEAFDEAVAQIAHATEHLLGHLTTSAAPKNRGEEAVKARARTAARYGTPPDDGAAVMARSSSSGPGPATDRPAGLVLSQPR